MKPLLVFKLLFYLNFVGGVYIEGYHIISPMASL